MIAHDELHVGIVGRDDLAHPFGPHGAMHKPQPLHLDHQLRLIKRPVARLNPVQTFWRSQLLGVHEFEKILERMVRLGRIARGKSADTPRAPCVDRTEEKFLDFVVYDRPEAGRVKIIFLETASRAALT
jgi:hypothetical protein